MQRWRFALSLAFTDGIPRRALLTALCVGTVLNLINQGDALFTGRPVDCLKLALTFCVPYCVSTHGAVTSKLAGRAAEGAPVTLSKAR